jgi:hypothetical protein
MVIIKLLPPDSTKQRSSSEANSYSAHYFMEPESSLPRSQEPASGPNPEQDQSTQLHIQFL